MSKNDSSNDQTTVHVVFSTTVHRYTNPDTGNTFRVEVPKRLKKECKFTVRRSERQAREDMRRMERAGKRFRCFEGRVSEQDSRCVIALNGMRIRVRS